MSASPMIIGHRGASALAPENTLVAFAQALDDGADGIEFDVRLARDSIPVVIHDSTLSRTATIDAAVAALSADELSRIDAGSWFNRKFPLLARSEYEGEAVPTLQNVFEALSTTSAILYLEMKCDGSGWQELVTKIVELIRNYAIAERTIVECFHLPAIAEVKRLDSNIRTAALFEPSIRRPLLKRMAMIDLARGCGADEIALHYTLVSQRVVGKAQELGIPCVVWTVDHPRWVQRSASLGIKALITNNPAAMVSARGNARC